VISADSACDSGRYAAALYAAQPEGEALYHWREGLLAHLRDRRNTCLHLYHRAKSFVIHRGMEDARAVVVADVADHYEREYLELDDRIDAVKTATWAELLEIYNAHRRAA
jgi:hypothetical protein